MRPSRLAWTRRRFLAHAGAGAGGVFLPAWLSACRRSHDSGVTPGVLRFENWVDYIDKPGGFFPTTSLEDFEAETGIEVTYSESIQDNQSWVDEHSADLAAGNPGTDLAVLTDDTVADLIDANWLEALDPSEIPAATELISPLRQPAYDPDRGFSVPWQAGFTGVAYNSDAVGEITTLAALFDPAYQGRVALFSFMRDTFGVTMLSLGIDISKATLEDAEAAAEHIRTAREAGQFAAIGGPETTRGLVEGTVDLAMAWSGDANWMSQDNPHIRFVFPPSGLMMWVDNLVVPRGAANIANALAWMRFAHRPEIAAKISAYVNYVSPVVGAREALLELAGDDEDLIALADNRLVFPDADTLAAARVFARLDGATKAQFQDLFDDAIAG